MTGLTNLLYYAHSGIRWLVVLATLVALGTVIYALATSRAWDATARRVMLAFSSLVGVQWLSGILYYGVYGSVLGTFTLAHQVEHATTMTLALLAAHGYMPFRKREAMSARTKYLIALAVIVVTLVLVYIGVDRLPGNRWLEGAPPMGV